MISITGASPPILSGMLLDAEFAPLLAGFSLNTLESDAATIVGVWPDGRIGYLNPAYRAFAEAAGAGELCVRWGLGANVFASIPEPLRRFYVELFGRARASSAPLTHLYECPTPELARTYALRMHSLSGGRGLLTSHSLVVARPHPESHAADSHEYRDADGILLQCMHCRRVRRASEEVRWDLVPEYVAKVPPRTSHGLCELCLEYHHGVD